MVFQRLYKGILSKIMSNSKRQLLLISSGTTLFTDMVRNEIIELLNKNQVKTLLYIPYAKLPMYHQSYISRLQALFDRWELPVVVEGINTKEDEIDSVKKAEALFICGGNTFVLQKTLQEKNLIEPIRKRCLEDGIPYIGYSAGTNIATPSIHTTNDMPVVLPSTLDSLNLVPFNINVHYSDGVHRDSFGRGSESRDMRLREFIDYNQKPVLALKDFSSLLVEGNKVKLLGDETTKFFGVSEPKELSKDADFCFLLTL